MPIMQDDGLLQIIHSHPRFMHQRSERIAERDREREAKREAEEERRRVEKAAALQAEAVQAAARERTEREARLAADRERRAAAEQQARDEQAAAQQREIEVATEALQQLRGEIGALEAAGFNAEMPPLTDPEQSFSNDLEGAVAKSAWESTHEGQLDRLQRQIQQHQKQKAALLALQREQQEQQAAAHRPQPQPRRRRRRWGPARVTSAAAGEPAVVTITTPQPAAAASAPAPVARSRRGFALAGHGRNGVEFQSYDQQVLNRVVRNYSTRENKTRYATEDYRYNGKKLTTSRWKSWARRKGSRDGMVEFARRVAENSTDEANRDQLIFAALLVVKRAIEAEDPKYTSVLWCMAKELTDNKCFNAQGSIDALSDFWRSQQGQVQGWNAGAAIEAAKAVHPERNMAFRLPPRF